MKTHNLIPGSAEWLAYRLDMFNASDAPAMLGCSPYKTRDKLLREIHTGVSAEVDQATQRIFDAGHRFEALARPLAEEMIGEELWPATCSEGRLSASLDGAVMAMTTLWEHKGLNAALRAVFDEMDQMVFEHSANVDGGAMLPLMYRVQMQQQMMVTGAKRVLFMASTWGDQDQLIEERDCWYYSDPKLARQITDGWLQFAADLADYVLVEPVVKTIGRTPENLPALHIELTGAVTDSNLDAYKEHALAVRGAINRTLETDQQFVDAEKTVKWCADVEERLAGAKQNALGQTASIDALFRTIDSISAETRAVRLELFNLVKARKECIRGDLVTDARMALARHVDALNARLGKAYMPATVADFAGAIKGKKSIDSMRDAINAALANAKVEASGIADKIQTNLATLRELATAHAFLFADAGQIVLKANDDLTLLVKSRIDFHQCAEAKRLDDERVKIRAEEAAKLERERISADMAREQAGALASREKLLSERADLEAQQRKQTEAAPVVVATAPVLATQAPVLAAVAPTAPAANETATLSLGEIKSRFGFTITAEGMSMLGFEAKQERQARLYLESDWPHICDAVAKRAASLRNMRPQEFKAAA